MDFFIYNKIVYFKQRSYSNLLFANAVYRLINFLSFLSFKRIDKL